MKNFWDVIAKAFFFGKNLCQGRNDYGTGGIFYTLSLAPKIKYCLTINEFGISQQRMTFKGFNDSKRLLDRSQCFDMLKGLKLSTTLPKSWKISSNNGIMIPTKKFNDCKDGILCTTSNNQANENQGIEANLNLLKIQASNEFGLKLTFYRI